MMRHAPALLAALVLTACAPEPVVVEDAPLAGPFAVQGGRIVDAHGAEILLRGVNLSQTAKSAPFHPAETEDADGRAALRAHGPVALRYLTSWAAIEPQDGAFDEAYLADLGARVGALADAGHFIVLDLHQDLFGVGFTGGNGAPAFACAQAAYDSFEYVTPWFRNYQSPHVQGCFDALFADEALLARMAAALRRAVDVAQAAAGAHLVGVDVINEPHPGSSSPAAFDARLMRYYEIAAEALEGTGVALLFEPNVTHNLGEDTTFTRAPTSTSSPTAAVFAPHLYPFDAELGRYADASALAGQLAHFKAEADALASPLVLGELGPLLHDPARLAYVDDVLFLADVHAAGAFAWDWSAASDRGLLREGAEDVAARFLRPHARRVGGTNVVQSFDPAARVLSLAFDDGGVAAPSEIVWPAAWGAFEVQMSDGIVQIDGDVVTWRHETGVAHHTLTVTSR